MRYPLFHLAITAVVLALVITPHSQAGDARQALAEMLEAAESLTYKGTFVYIQGQHVEAMLISHQAGDTQAEAQHWQHLSALNGAAREIIVTDEEVMCLLPDQQIACQGVKQRRSPFPISLPKDLQQLSDFYHFQILGEDRTAGHPTRVISVEPADNYRFGYRFWLHADTSMVLRSALLDENGRVLEQLMFTEFSLQQPSDLPAQPPTARLQTVVDEQSADEPLPVVDSSWEVGELPPGFERILHNRHGDGDQSTEHMVFSDGLATVSVFLEPLPPGSEAVLDGFSRMGAMNAFGVTRGDHQIMVVGEVPELTVRTIAERLSYVE